MQIRPVEERDFEAIAALTNIYIQGTAVHFGEVPVTAAELRDGWLEGRDRFPFLVAVGAAGSEPFLGYAKAYTWRSRSAYRFTAEVGIYIQPTSQGQGVGTRLYTALVEACRAAGFQTLVAGITLPNDASVRLHERVGFRRCAEFPEAGWKLNRWHDVGFWHLRLAPPGMPPRRDPPRMAT